MSTAEVIDTTLENNYLCKNAKDKKKQVFLDEIDNA